MADLYKIQYANNTLTYPGWNGFLQYENMAVPFQRYEMTIFKSENGDGVSAGTVLEPFSAFDEIGNDVTAEGLYTDAGYPITYETTEGGSCTGDQIYIPGSTGITLQTAYDTYYRLSGYEVTGGTIENNVLIPTGPCTAKAVYKVNYFTATGNFEKGSNVSVVSTYNAAKSTNVAAKYALHQSHTGDIPTAWYATSNRWKPNNVSSYSITLNTKMTFTTNKSIRNGITAGATGVSLIGSTATQSQGYVTNLNGDQSMTYNYNKTFTTTTQNVNYGVSAKLAAGASQSYYSTATYVANNTNGTWTATGIAP